jgi:hypothetical protein
MSELIDRQEAIDALARTAREKFNLSDEYNHYLAGLMDGELAIKELPTIQPEVLACGNGELIAQPSPQWILCTERMPEEHEWIGTKKFGTTISDEVYVTFENEKGERFCQHMSFQNGELSRYDKAYMEAWYKGSKPIAWMPLPMLFEGGIE